MTAQVYRWEFRAPAGELSLPRISWEGGPDYWTVAEQGDKMTNAETSGWSDPTFFPIAVFYPKPSHADTYATLGINVYMACQDHGVADATDVTDEGIFLIPNYTVVMPDGDTDNGWSPAQVSGNTSVVGWFIYDEPDQGEGVYWNVDVPGGPEAGGGSSDERRLEVFQDETQNMRDLDDGRFMFANWGNGVLNTHWAEGVMDDYVQTIDACCVDKYAYTSPEVRDIIDDSGDWPVGAAVRRSATYGWFVDQMRSFDNPASRRPQWVFLEVKKPLLGESPAEIISHAELEGAIWSAIAHEARGIAYFDHSGHWPPNSPTTDPNTGTTPTTEEYTLIDGPATYATAVSAINDRVTEMAPVLNTQSYDFDFGATGVDTMLKGKDGYAYIFASIALGGATGSKTFTLTGSGITGTVVEVLYESRTVNVSAGQFVDSFANEYSHHIYKVAI